MKIKLVDRVIVGAYAVLGAVMLIVFGLWTTGLCSAADAGCHFAATLEESLWLRLGLCLVLAALLALSGHIIYGMLTGFQNKKNACQTLKLTGGESGEIRVTTAVLESLVRQAVGDVDGVKSMAVTLGGDQTVLSATLDITVDMGVKLGDVTGMMQRAAKEALERFTGMTVKDVTVMVSAIAVENQTKKADQTADHKA